MKQGSAEWLAARVGKITASRFGAVMDLSAKGLPNKSRRDLVQTLTLELLIGEAEEVYVNEAMQHGTATEPLARQWLSFVWGMDIREYGLVVHPQIPFVAVSPDGEINADTGVEIKCPVSKRIHLDRLLNGTPEKIAKKEWVIDHDHWWQMQGQMAAMGWKRCLYVSFMPSMPPGLQGHVIELARDDEAIERLLVECSKVYSEALKGADQLREEMQ